MKKCSLSSNKMRGLKKLPPPNNHPRKRPRRIRVEVLWIAASRGGNRLIRPSDLFRDSDFGLTSDFEKVRLSDLLHLQRHMSPIQRRSFVLGNLGQGDIVIGQRADLGRAGGGEIALEAQYFETGALTAFEFLLFRPEGRFGINPGFAG